MAVVFTAGEFDTHVFAQDHRQQPVEISTIVVADGAASDSAWAAPGQRLLPLISSVLPRHKRFDVVPESGNEHSCCTTCAVDDADCKVAADTSFHYA